ncbi:MAG TPA: CHAT domain-containing tetratricopeptide repeat protein [Candidatus Eisenbacteria bacterium]|nr:CHAT domain-containing tetratricopeptide repeat protein [Candidatus Eisenbacteria bacterium]
MRSGEAHGSSLPIPESPALASWLSAADSASRALLENGDTDGALALYERELARARASLSPEHPELAARHERLGAVAWTAGDYERARTELEAALLLHERAGEHDSTAIAGVLGLLGSIVLEQGDPPAAVRLHERALDLVEPASPSGPATAAALERLGASLAASGKHQEARTHHLRALAIREASGDSLGVASCLQHVALEAVRAGDAAAARAAFLRARSILNDGASPDHPGVAVSVSGLAALARADGDLDRARAHDREAVAIRRRALGSEHPLLAEALVAYAGSLIRTGHSADAVDAALEAEGIRRDHLRSIVRSVPESQALRYEARLASGIGAAVAASIRTWDSTVVERVWDAVTRSRALVLDGMASRHRWTQLRADSAILALASDAARARQGIARLSARGPDGMDPRAYRATLERLKATREDLERKLLARRPDAVVDLKRDGAGIADVRQALPAGGGIVSLVRYLDPATSPQPTAGPGAAAGDGSPGRSSPGTWSYAAFVTSGASSHGRVVPLGDAEELDSLVATWRRAMTVRGRETGGASDGAAPSAERLGSILRQRLWDPVRPHLAGAERVIFVPDGSFHLVNPMALPLDGGRYLVEEGPTFQILSSERDLIGPARPAAPGTGFLAVADPDFDAPRRSMSALDPVRQRDPQRERDPGPRDGADPVYRGSGPCAAASAPGVWPPLPGSAREVEEIARLWERRHGGATHVFRDAAATEGAVQKHAPGKRAIHLATHGFFEGSCEGENPLLSTGLVLAGANRAAADSAEGMSTEDGLLTADEISGMDLAGLESVVLSGCDTGVGVVRAGEGVFGLRRAFEIAGAQSLVLTLWPVTDRDAGDWTVRFYEARLVKGLDTASAARDASRRVLEQQRAAGQAIDPFPWGAFIAAGR